MVLWCSRGAIEQSLLISWALLLPQKLSGTAESEAPTKPSWVQQSWQLPSLCISLQ